MKIKVTITDEDVKLKYCYNIVKTAVERELKYEGINYISIGISLWNDGEIAFVFGVYDEKNDTLKMELRRTKVSELRDEKKIKAGFSFELDVPPDLVKAKDYSEFLKYFNRSEYDGGGKSFTNFMGEALLWKLFDEFKGIDGVNAWRWGCGELGRCDISEWKHYEMAKPNGYKHKYKLVSNPNHGMKGYKEILVLTFEYKEKEFRSKVYELLAKHSHRKDFELLLGFRGGFRDEVEVGILALWN